MESTSRAMQSLTLQTVVFSAALLTASIAAAQTQQEKRFSCGPKPTVSIVNEYGPITVHPSTSNQVIVRYVLHSDKVEVDTNQSGDQSGDRITVESHLLQGATGDTAQVDYEVLVPAGSVLFIHSNSGTLSAEHLTGDVSVEGASTPVDLRGMSDGHVRVRTLSGNILLADIRQVHVVANTISGDVTMRNVDGPLVEVSSNNGKIHYDGDFGGMGSYKLNSHSGDIEASIPATASFDVTATSVKGQVDTDFPLQRKEHSITVPEKGRSFVGVAGRAASLVFLHTFSGKIRLKQR
jgi:DUF4097 and DUF4098 domain-containing protein YvlB